MSCFFLYSASRRASLNARVSEQPVTEDSCRHQTQWGPTLNKIFVSAVTLFFFTGCVVVPKEGYKSLPTSRTFHAGFDRVWSVLVSEISTFAAIKAIDKASGLITTESNASTGLMSEMVLKVYAHRPPNILGTWDAGRVLLTFFVNSQGSSTTVRITAHFAGFETNVVHSWMEWPTSSYLQK